LTQPERDLRNPELDESFRITPRRQQSAEELVKIMKLAWDAIGVDQHRMSRIGEASGRKRLSGKKIKFALNRWLWRRNY
jgi:aromatic ring hydroxylase